MDENVNKAYDESTKPWQTATSDRYKPKPKPAVPIEPPELKVERIKPTPQNTRAKANYQHKNNTITLDPDAHYNSSEEDIIDSINHETSHWAQYMMLTPEEREQVDRAYKTYRDKKKVPLIERLAIQSEKYPENNPYYWQMTDEERAKIHKAFDEIKNKN